MIDTICADVGCVSLSGTITIVEAELGDADVVGEVHAASWAVAYASFFAPEFFAAAVDRAGLTKQALAELVDELEDHGYLERVADPGDRPGSKGHARATWPGASSCRSATAHTAFTWARLTVIAMPRHLGTIGTGCLASRIQVVVSGGLSEPAHQGGHRKLRTSPS